jgi:hypothetical protein
VVTDVHASAYAGNGLVVSVTFDPLFGCDLASLSVMGNSTIMAWSLEVDGVAFASKSVSVRDESDIPISAELLSPAELAALKGGRRAVLTTDGGWMPIDLTGSASAINRAWRACEAEIAAAPPPARPAPTYTPAHKWSI